MNFFLFSLYAFVVDCIAWITEDVNRHFPGALKTHTNAHAVRGRPTLKDVKRQFRNGSVRELNETQI